MTGTKRFAHIETMSDERGLFEHALLLAPRLEHGYCTDDNARLLVACSSEPPNLIADEVTDRLGAIALRFVQDSIADDGRIRNRMEWQGRWTDQHGTADCWGRAVWSLGVAATCHHNSAIRERALVSFDSVVRQRSTWPRAMAFAALGAAAVLRADPSHDGARRLLIDSLGTIGVIPPGDWPWPERRMSYANATLAEAVIVAGDALDRPGKTQQGLDMLAFLLALETIDGHLSVTGVGGRCQGEMGPQFDQQPIEAAAMAEACRSARRVTGDESWAAGITMAARWFEGSNDLALVMYDAQSGGGYDGLHADRVNLNEGAESTLAYISTMQCADALVVAR